MVNQTIVVTGGTGFVGANLIKKLNAKGVRNIIIIDNYDERKFNNIKGCSFIDLISYTKGLEYIEQELNKHLIGGILHIGANADVLVRDAEVMLHANYDHSKFYLNYSQERQIPLIYASSSAIYGNSNNCVINTTFEEPHNVYSWSKWMFDSYVLNNMSGFKNRVIGLRFFNIFGMGEKHKDKNASLPHRFYQFIQEKGFIDVFDKEIQRDYVWVDDVTSIIMDLIQNPDIPSGIYNLGSGNPVSHKKLAKIVAEVFIERSLRRSDEDLIRSIPMPEELNGNFQFYTCAEDLPEFVRKYTYDNEGKISRYIHQMIDMDSKYIDINGIASHV